MRIVVGKGLVGLGGPKLVAVVARGRARSCGSVPELARVGLRGTGAALSTGGLLSLADEAPSKDSADGSDAEART